MAASNKVELFSSLISNIKNYTGTDPLRPWLQGIRKMKEALAPHILKEKLPRFLQKCAQTFESDRRYWNDTRYIRVWIQLMDYVDDARVILRRMEKNHIGLKRAMFYSAYALYYEKKKKFEEAERMYHLGVQNLAEPGDELQKSYELFLYRMKLLKERKNKKLMLSRPNRIPQHGRTTTTENRHLEKGNASQICLSKIKCGDQLESVDHINPIQGCSKEGCCGGTTSSPDAASNLDEASYGLRANPSNNGPGSRTANMLCEDQGSSSKHGDNTTPSFGDDTVVVKFVGSAIVGKSEAEDACHHGLVDPTVNMKEAMNDISNMFKEPLEPEPAARRRRHQSKPRESQQSNSLEVFVDENMEAELHPDIKLKIQDSPKKQTETESQKPFVGAFKIWTEDDDDDDDEESDGCSDGDGMGLKEHSEVPNPTHIRLNSRGNAETNTDSAEHARMNGDTVIRRFVGSTVFDDPEVENACHHGLVDPTVNLKEAMDDINSMFGKSLNFVRASRPKKLEKPMEQKPATRRFCILADDDDDDLEENSRAQPLKGIPSKFAGESEMFETTVFTREAMADINEMFGKPLDF